jgi:hypothetical protein
VDLSLACIVRSGLINIGKSLVTSCDVWTLNVVRDCGGQNNVKYAGEDNSEGDLRTSN